MNKLLALAARAWRRAQPGIAGLTASYAFGYTNIPLRSFPEVRFDEIIGGLAMLLIIVALSARVFGRRLAQRHRAVDQPRVEPTLVARAAVRAQPLQPGAWSLALLNALGSRRFEAVCSACFDDQGYEVRATPYGAVRPVDLLLSCREAERPRILVRCVAAQGATTDEQVPRELLALLDTEVPSKGIVVTSGTFTPEARTLADGRKLHLIDGEDLLWRIGRLNQAWQADLLEYATAGDYAAPTCRVCGAEPWRCTHDPAGAAPGAAAPPDLVEADHRSRLMLL